MFKDLLKLNRQLLNSQESLEKSGEIDTHHKHLASVMVVDKERGKILLGHRKSDGIWTPPAGHMQSEESPVQAAIREAFEEANLQFKPKQLRDLPSVPLKKNKMCHVFITYVDSKALKIHVTNDPDHEVDRWEWFDLNGKLPKEIDAPRLISINNAKMKVFGMRKAIIENPEGGIDLNTSEQSLDELASKEDDWVGIIVEAVQNAEYGETPKEIALPKMLKLILSKVDDGIYSGFVKKEDPMAGDNGEVQVQLMKMTPEAMVQALKAKGYIPRHEKDTQEVTALAENKAEEAKNNNDYKGLYEALKTFDGELHLHLHKSLLEELTKAKAVPIGTVHTWGNGKKYRKEHTGWTEESQSKKKDQSELKPVDIAPPAPKQEVENKPKIDIEKLRRESAQKLTEIRRKLESRPGKPEVSPSPEETLMLERIKNKELIPTKESLLPPEIDQEVQKRTNMISKIDFSKAPKKVQKELAEKVNQCNVLIDSMGIKFKTPINFVCTSNVKSTKRVRGTHSSTTNTITLKDMSESSKTVMHEIGHAIDYAMQENKTPSRGKHGTQGRSAEAIPLRGRHEGFTGELGDKYRELNNLVMDSEYYTVIGKEAGGDFHRYLAQPTEVFARAFEVYSYAKAEELVKQGKIEKDFISDFLPDVFKTKDPEVVKAKKEYDSMWVNIKALSNKETKIHADINKEVADQVTLPLKSNDEAEIDAALDARSKLRTKLIEGNQELKNTIAEKTKKINESKELFAEKIKGKGYQSIPENQRKEYTKKVSQLVEFILKNDTIRKAWLEADLLDLFKSLTECNT